MITSAETKTLRFVRRNVSICLGSIIAVATLAAAEDESIQVRSTLGEMAERTEELGRTTGVEEIGHRQDDGALLLTLDQAIALALERNVTIAVERYQRSLAILGILQGRSIYDLQLGSSLSTQSEVMPPRSTLQAADILMRDTEVANLSLAQLVPSGGNLQLDFNNTLLESSDQAVNPNPQFEIDLDLTLTQPLLRNRGRAVTERNLIVARTDAAISLEDFQTRVEDILQQVIDGYWNLVEAREQLAVAEESLELAEDLDRMNRVQVKVGTLAALEVIQSEAGVAARKEGIITLRAQVGDAADVLRGLVNLEATEAWDVEIVPVSSPEASTEFEVDVEEAIRTAFLRRPDMRRRRLQNETLELDARVARNRKLPRLDLSATYGYNALDGDRLVTDDNGDAVFDDGGVPVRTPGGYGGALDQIAAGDFEGWAIGLQVGFPIQNRDARARSAQAALAAGQGALLLRELELAVRAQVRSAVRALEAAAQRVETAEVSSRLAKRSLEAEQKRYENGLSTSFEVLQFQEDLSEARSREVSAIVTFRRAQAVYYRSIGRLLERYGLTLAGDG